MRPVAVYSALRLGLFLAALIGLFALGARGLLLVALSLLVSFGLSFVVLRRRRDEVTRALMQRKTQKPRRARRGLGQLLRDDAAAEDAALDAAASDADRPEDRGTRA